MIVGKMWGKTPYYEWDDRYVLRLILLFFIPISSIGALWIIKIENVRIAVLPFLGIFALLVGGVLGLIAAKLLKLNRKESGSMFTCGSFTNITSIGGVICYLFLGEKGYALFSLYKLFELVTYFAIGFPIAKLFSSNVTIKENMISRLKTVFTDIFVVVALVSMAIGTFLNLSGIERPEFYKIINAIFIPLGTVILLISIGLGMKFGKVRNYGIERTVIKTAKWHPAFRLDESVFLWGTKSSISLDQRITLSQCKSFDEFINVERRYFSVIDEVIDLGKTVSYEMKVELNPCRSFDETVHLKLACSVTSDEQVSLSRNYMDSAKVDETIVILPRAWCDEVITLTATPIIIGFDEALLAEKSSLAKANEVIDLTMTYTPQGGGGSIPSYLREALFNESITITKPVFDESITITNEHNVTLLGDVIRDSDLKAKGIIIYAGQDFVLEQ